MKKLAKVCILFYNLAISGKNVKGCLKLEAKLGKIKVAKLDIGCFKIPPNAAITETLLTLLSKGRQSVKSYERVVFN